MGAWQGWRKHGLGCLRPSPAPRQGCTLDTGEAFAGGRWHRCSGLPILQETHQAALYNGDGRTGFEVVTIRRDS